ncbi:MAG: LPS-assembly protein LptD [Calditrichaeota bacterium]|nr:MAG: LPS-assembly protein LptD [Calditrichota bacterium]
MYFILFSINALAQVQPPSPVPTSPDTLTPPPSTTSGVEGPVKYWAEKIRFSLPDRITELEGDVRIEYQNVTLTAGKVKIDWNRNYLIAEGTVDSIDANGNPIYSHLPVLTEKGEEPIKGVRLEYDFTTRRGKIREGYTQMDPGFYKGKDVHKIGEETLLIQDGFFTSCDLEDHPHYYFRGKKMRVRLKKVAVARPIIFYIADVPVFALPFGAFSLQRGRRSGIILPTYGESSFGGRYLQNFGYYWAPSDYFDATIQGTFYEKTGLVYKSQLRYKKRYAFSGDVSGTFSPRDVTTGIKRRRWEIRFTHRQTIGQTINLTANGSFLSDKDFRQNYYTDINQRLQQNLTTNVTLQKRLPGSRTLSLNLQRNENLQTGKIDFDFPILRYSQPQKSIFPKNTGSREKWYHRLRYSYNSLLRSKASRTPITTSEGTSAGFSSTRKSGWQHNLTQTFNTNLFRYFKINQSLNLTEIWVPQYLNYSFVDSLNDTRADTVKGFRARHTFTTSLNASTTIYGLWEIPFSPLKVIRHKMDPRIGFSYRPDFSDPAYGYVQTFRDTTGKEITRDRFSGSLFGTTPSGEQRNLNIGINNLFQGKIIRNGEEKKIDLFRLNTSTSYNFARDSLRWNNINTSIIARPTNNFSIDFRSTHSLYKKQGSGSGRINRFVWADGFQLPDLVNWRVAVNARFRLSSKDKTQPTTPAPPPPGETAQDPTDIFTQQTTDNLDEEERQIEEALANFDRTWSMDFQFTYSYSQGETGFINRHFDLNLSAQLQLTRNWYISYQSRLDLMERQIDSQTFIINRDLHCWTMNFTWSPNPAFSFYRLEIKVKASALKDLKLTKTSGRRPLF